MSGAPTLALWFAGMAFGNAARLGRSEICAWNRTDAPVRWVHLRREGC